MKVVTSVNFIRKVMKFLVTYFVIHFPIFVVILRIVVMHHCGENNIELLLGVPYPD